MNSIKAKSQTEKRLDGFSGGGDGGSYTAGEGIAIGNNVIALKPATSDELGGVNISGEYHKTGIWKDNGVLEIKSALPGRLGGIKIGDGLIPALDSENIPTDVVKIRVGDGLSFMENNEETEDPIEIAENTYGGRRLSMRSATKEKIGGVKPGDGLNVDEETGEIYIKAGSGIKIEDLSSSTGEEWSELSIKPADPLFIGGVRVSNTTSGLLLEEDGSLAVNVGEGLEITDENKLTVTGGTGEGDNYLLLTEETLSDFVHEYTEVGYHSGSKIILATQKPNIVIQGYTAGNTNQKALAPIYTSVDISGLASASATALTDYKIETEIYSKTDTLTTFRILVNGASAGTFQTFDPSVTGFVLIWTTIYGESYATYAPDGCVYLEVYAVKMLASGSLQFDFVATPSRKFFPFDSKAEYHSAICLTKEENVLTSITETVTEV